MRPRPRRRSAQACHGVTHISPRLARRAPPHPQKPCSGSPPIPTGQQHACTEKRTTASPASMRARRCSCMDTHEGSTQCHNGVCRPTRPVLSVGRPSPPCRSVSFSTSGSLAALPSQTLPSRLAPLGPGRPLRACASRASLASNGRRSDSAAGAWKCEACPHADAGCAAQAGPAGRSCCRPVGLAYRPVPRVVPAHGDAGGGGGSAACRRIRDASERACKEASARGLRR